jgi:hypothetical protein
MSETYTEDSGNVVSIRNMVSGVDWEEATNPPAFSSSRVNGRAAMVGTGTGRIISSEAAVAAAVTGDDASFTLAALVDVNAAAGNVAQTFGFGNSAVANDSYVIFGNNSGPSWSLQKEDDTGAFVQVADQSRRPLGAQLLWFVADGATGGIFRGNDTACLNAPGALRPFNVGTLTVDQAGIFCRPDSSADQFATSGQALALVLVFNRALLGADRIGLANAIKQKWQA